MLGCVTELAERAHDVRLGLPFFRVQLFREILIKRSWTCAVKEYEDFEFLFHFTSLSIVILSEAKNLR